ncbi:MAG TPA: tetratricopeptide repeat protein, partial [Kofleriaceae bacterium]
NLDSGIVHSAGAVRPSTHGSALTEPWDTRSGVSRAMYHNSGPTHAAHPTPSGPMRAPSEPGLTMPPASSGSMPRAGSPNNFNRAATPMPQSSSVSSAPIVSEILSSPGPMPELKKSGMAVFGWIMLMLILLGGGGALAYMMLYKKEPTTTTPQPAPDDKVIDKNNAKQPTETDEPQKEPVKKPTKSDKTDKPDKTDKVDTKVDTKTPVETKGSGDNTAEKKDTKKPTASKTVAVIDDKMTWKQISDAAKKSESAGDWDAALLAYQKLEKAKGYAYPGWAVYKQAWAAFQLNDTNNALTLAQRASTLPGNQKPDAKLLYADALFKQGDYKRAKDFYIGLRKQFVGETKKQTMVAKKITACNQKLKLPDNDGIK